MLATIPEEKRMKANRAHWVFLTTTLLLLLFGCSSHSQSGNFGAQKRPSNSRVEKAVTAMLAKGVPAPWIQSNDYGVNAKITSVEVKEWGVWDKESGDWPVRIRVVGAATPNLPPGIYAGDNKPRQFDTIAEGHVFKDEFGKWQIVVDPGGLDARTYRAAIQ